MTVPDHPRIEFADIRVGDTVEVRHAGIVSTITVATRNDTSLWNAQGGELAHVATHPPFRWYLIERTAPDLPTVPTWGWVHCDTPGKLRTDFDRWALDVDIEGTETLVAESQCCSDSYLVDEVRDFIPAALVPQGLLDELRALVTKAANSERTADGPLSMFLGLAGRFLVAVDQNAEQTR